MKDLRNTTANMRQYSLKFIRIFTILTVLICFGFISTGAESFAAATSKTPDRPVIASTKTSSNKITIKWGKVKNAKKYKVYVAKGANAIKWKYVKSVKKTKANKAKYDAKINFKVKASGKKYKVYKRVSTFKLVKTTTKRYFTYKGKYNTTYRFAIKAVNGKLNSKYSKIRKVKIPKKEPQKSDSGTEPGSDPSEDQASDPASESPEPDPKSDLNIVSPGLENMIWSWWYYPQVISHNDQGAGQKIFWGYATNEGYCGVAEYDEKSGQVTKTALKQADQVDDHNGLALNLLDDNRLICAYAGGHNTDNYIHIRISDKPLDTGSFSKHITLESSGKTCYSQIFKSSGRYWLFYRVNNNSWACRTSSDGTEWTKEVILVKAPMQYYCRFVPTTKGNIVRILMYSNPSEKAPEIRMGFLNTGNGDVFNADMKTALARTGNNYDDFGVILEPQDGKTQRLFDVAVTPPDKTRFLYASFTNKKKLNDSTYYLYDNGKSYEITSGGKALMDPKYQLGASFIDPDNIVCARNDGGIDYVETYKFNGSSVKLSDTLDISTGIAAGRAARPITDINGHAVLWHSGYYNSSKYTDFDTDAELYLMDEQKTVTSDPAALEGTKISGSKDANVNAVKAYADKLYSENIFEDYKKAEFTWSQEHHKRGWLYYNGFMLDSLLTLDPVKYSPEIKKFCDQHITSKGSVWGYVSGELDWALPAVLMEDLLDKDLLNEDEIDKYKSAINFVYNELEKQTAYPEAGGLLQHSERDGVPTSAWSKWNIALDGIYMSQLFEIRLAKAIDDGKIEITSADGTEVSSEYIWNGIYDRMKFALEKMRDADTGLMYHVYSVELAKSNEIVWGRGMGWFTMALLEAAEGMPDVSKRTYLTNQYAKLMDSLIEWQDAGKYLWYNVVDRGTDLYKNQIETSGSAMFSYCLLKGYKDGLLKDEAYMKSGLLAFNSLVETRLTEAGLTDTLIGMGPGEKPEYYQNNAFVTNEAKGIAPLILATSVLN